MSAPWFLRSLRARYDSAALQVAPPDPAATRVPVSQAISPSFSQRARPALEAWCFAGAGDGGSPLWNPWALPRVPKRFAVAVLTGVPGAPDAELPALAEAFSRHIDGSDQLAALTGAAARIALRLRVKWQDALWWRARQPTDPWDSGYLPDGEAALQALEAFCPRRATLLVALNLPAAALAPRIALLARRSAGFAHPVRLLVVGTPVPAGGGRVAVIAVDQALSSSSVPSMS